MSLPGTSDSLRQMGQVTRGCANSSSATSSSSGDRGASLKPVTSISNHGYQ